MILNNCAIYKKNVFSYSYIFDITLAGNIVLLSIGLLAGTMGIKSAGLLSKN